MKKVLFFAGLASAVLSLVGCNKEADFFGRSGRKMQIVLTDVDTRTVNDGLSTKWVDGDALNVFYAPAGTTDYSDNSKFEVDDAASNHAAGTATLTADAYDWYLLYPYSSYIKTPANTKDGYTYIGSRSDQAQVQTGYDSKAHLAGGSSAACFPLYGVAKNVSATDVPVVAMKHVAAVVAVNVKNDTNKGITISQVDFTAPESIVGGFYVNFAEDPVSFTDYTYVSSTASLAVKEAPVLAAGETATFYMGIKPFSAKAGDKLSLKITADAGVVEKELTLAGNADFKAGVIKKLNVGFASATVLPTITIADINTAITAESTSSAPCSFEGKLEGAVVTFVSGNYVFIQDETAGILYYKSGHGFKAGDKLEGNVSGSGYSYNGLKEVTSLNVETVTHDAPVPAAEELTLAELNADYDRYMSVRVKVKDVTVSAPFSGRNTTMTDGDETLALRDQKNGLTIEPGIYDITGYPGYFNNPQFGVWTQDDIVALDAPFLNAEAEQTEVPATATSVKIIVSGNVSWTAEPSDGATVDPASGEGSGEITVSFPENTDPENEKEYTVFVRTDNPTLVAAGTEEFEINITQAKADAAGMKTVTVDFSKQGYTNGETLSAVTIDGITFTFDKGTNGNAPKYYTTGNAVRLYGGNSMNVSAGGKTIVSIELTFDSGEGNNAITTDVPTYEEPTWTGEATSVTFTIGGTSGHRRIQTVTVQYKDEDVPVTLQSIAVSGQQTEFNVGDTFTLGSNAKVIAKYSDGNEKDVTAQATHSNPDMSTAGSKEVTVSYTEGGITKEAKYDISVKGGSAAHAGTAEDPFTVADAINVTTALGLGGTSSEFYFTKGIISQIDEVSPDYGNATYYISDDGTTANQFEVYHGKYIGNISFTAEDQIKVGDEVVVNGKLTYHKSPDVPEVAAGNYIYSLTRNGSPVYAMAAIPSRTTVSAAASTVKVNVYGNVEWSCAATTPATIDKDTGSGIGSFTVNIPENTGNARVIMVTVLAAGVESVIIRIDQEKKSDTGFTTVTVGQDFLAANQNGQMDDVISYTNDSDYGTTTVTELRIYKGKTLTVSAAGGHTIKSIKMTCTANGTAKQGPGCWGDGAPEGYTFEVDGKTGTWTGSASSVAFTAKDNQVRIVELIVAYE